MAKTQRSKNQDLALVPGGLAASVIITVQLFAIFSLRNTLSPDSQQVPVSIILSLIALGLCLCFFWRRIPSNSARSMTAAAYLFILWPYLAGLAIAPGHFPDLLKFINIAGIMGLLVIGALLYFSWLIHQGIKFGTIMAGAGGGVITVFLALEMTGYEELSRILLRPQGEGLTYSVNDYTPFAYEVDSGRSLDDSYYNEIPTNTLAEPKALEEAVKPQRLLAKPAPKANRQRAARARALDWSYSEPTDPLQWGHIRADYRLCQIGKEQSPINIPLNWELKRHLHLFYHDSPFTVLDNGYTIEVQIPRGQQSHILNETYELRDIHFRSPAEHWLGGRSFPMEIQLIHRNDQGAIAILGVFVKIGAENPAIEKLWRYLPRGKGQGVHPRNVRFQPRQLLPENLESYHYYGSMTTPPCRENIHWNILRDPIEMSEQQIEKFRAKYPSNVRPVQNLYYR